MYTTIRPKIRALINLIFLFVHDHSTKIIRVLIYIFISFVHDHSTKIRGHSYSLIYLLINCVNVSYSTFMAVLIYSVHCIHGDTALIFRTLCPWLYEVSSDHVSKDLSARALRMENERWMLWKCQTFSTNSLNFQAYLSRNTSNIFWGNLKFPEH